MDLNKDTLYQKYIIENNSCKECSLIFNCSESLIKKRIKIYGIKKDRKEALKKQEETMLRLYGVSNAAKLENNNFKKNNPSKDKSVKIRSINTYKKNYSNSINDKRKNTCLEKYGVEHYMKSDAYRENLLKSNPNYAIIKDKELLKEKILGLDEPTYSNLCNCLGYSYAPIHKAVAEHNLGHLIKKEYSKTNIYWHDLILKNTGYDFNYEGNIFTNHYEHVDLYLESKKIAIDINPTITHNTQFNPFQPDNKSSIDTKYHFRRAIDAENNEWLLYQIFDWDDEEKVVEQLKNMLGLSETIYARKCVIKEVNKETKKDFLNKHHLQGDINSLYNYGLYYRDNLVAVMTFGKVRFKKIAEYELLRFCSTGRVVGGAGKLFNYFLKRENPTSVMTYSDMSKGHGLVYKKLGFQFYGYAGLNALYAPLNIKGVALKTQTASKEYSKYKKEFSSCKEYFNSKNWYRINDAGNKIWIWNNSNYSSGN